jgi:pimeloyl-ACP methyl ester carboxylesterase
VALSEQGARITGSYVEAPYELVTLEGVNHWAPTQAPDAVAAAVLARISAA